MGLREYLKITGLEDFAVSLAKCAVSISDIFDGLGEIRRRRHVNQDAASLPGLGGPKSPVHLVLMRWQASSLRAPSMVHHIGKALFGVDPSPAVM